MESQTLQLGDLVPDDLNANAGTDRGREMLRGALERHGAARSIVLDRNNRIIAGNKTAEQAAQVGLSDVVVVDSDGTKLIAVRRTDVDLDTPEGRALALADNRTSEVGLAWDTDVIARLGADVDLSPLWDQNEISNLLTSAAATAPPTGSPLTASLAERFGVPPFSILDARQGYWVERKRSWLNLGIESELGRESKSKNKGLLFSNSAQSPAMYELKNSVERDLGRKLSWEEFVALHPEANALSGTSIFDPVLCELAYRWFAPRGGRVLDPFAGGSVRGVVAAMLGLDYQGIELREEQVNANRAQAEAICQPSIMPEGAVMPRWYCGDSRNIDDIVGTEQYDLVFSCPPYADLEVYSDDERDLSTLDYAEFVDAYRHIIARSVAHLRDNRFACFVVGDVRDRHGFYRNFVSDTIAAFVDAGMSLYNEAILITQFGSLPIRVGSQFGKFRKLGKAHQNVLVFYKGDPRAILSELGEVEFTEEVPGTEGAPGAE
jgi:DNA modification methylase